MVVIASGKVVVGVRVMLVLCATQSFSRMAHGSSKTNGKCMHNCKPVNMLTASDPGNCHT